MRLGFIGLGKMGQAMVFHLLEQNIEVVAWNRSSKPVEEVVTKGATPAENPADILTKLDAPRIIWIMLPQGPLVDEMIDQITDNLDPGDLIIDGGNSFYKDSIRRAEKLSAKGIHFMDVGVSGGPSGARKGACLMVGGSKTDYESVKEILQKLALSDEALGYFGGAGAGHFAKMVHNGIEYGMMEAIAEGVAILKKSQFNYDLVDVMRVYNNGSVIESRLVGWTLEALQENHELSDISSKIDASGEGEWTVEAAKELGVDARVIEDSLKVRKESSEGSEDFRAKVVSAQRGKFGGHSVKKS